MGNGKNQADFTAMCRRLRQILSPEVPVCPGRSDMVSIYPHDPYSDLPVIANFRKKWQGQFETLIKTLEAGHHVPTRVVIDGELFEFGNQNSIDTVQELLNATKNQWLKMMRMAVKMRPDKDNKNDPDKVLARSLKVVESVIFQSLRENTPDIPDAESRLNLAFKYFAWYHHMVMKPSDEGAINPESTDRDNDGIDAELLFALFWPDTVVVTLDGPFLGRIQGIKSAQKSRVIHPRDLKKHLG